MSYDEEYGILHEIDKCVRCRACTVACQRWYQLDLNTLTGRAESISSDDWVVVKPQTTVDNPPFVRYSCWHCQGAPCASDYQGAGLPNSGCPFGAVKIAGYPRVRPNTIPPQTGVEGPASVNPGVTFTPGAKAKGAVYIDFNLCKPNDPLCRRQCIRNCFRGGYPRVGYGSSGWTGYVGDGRKAGKCTLCWDWISLQTDLALQKPVCVLSCPMKALTYDTVANIKKILKSKYPNYNAYSGHVLWGSKNAFSTPLASADPFVEDHISPLFDRVLSSSLGKTLAIPGVILGALYALYKRKTELSPVAKKG
jgi:Fe-S-cluster-containing dehydrogenase component